MNTKLSGATRRSGYASVQWLLLPAAVILIVLRIAPLLYTVVLSFTEWSLGDALPAVFVGTRNYAWLFHNPDFWQSLTVTFKFTFLATGMQFLVGMVVASALAHLRRGANASLTVVIMPMLATPVVVGALWRVLYQSEFGVINSFLTGIGLPKVAWLGNPKVALLAVALVDTWQWTAFVVLVMYAGIVSLPREAFEAAALDGANWIQQQVYVTLPFLKSLMTITLILRATDAFRTFDIVYVLTGGGPAGQTYVVSLYVFEQAFQRLNLGVTGALSVVLLIVMALIAVGLLSANRQAKR